MLACPQLLRNLKYYSFHIRHRILKKIIQHFITLPELSPPKSPPPTTNTTTTSSFSVLQGAWCYPHRVLLSFPRCLIPWEPLIDLALLFAQKSLPTRPCKLANHYILVLVTYFFLSKEKKCSPFATLFSLQKLVRWEVPIDAVNDRTAVACRTSHG